MKNHHILGATKVWSTLAECFWSLDKVRMWWYNILGDNNGSISHILQLFPITPGSVLITSKLVALKRISPEPILTVKIIEWRKSIDYFGQIIEATHPGWEKRTNIFPYWVYNKPFVCKAPYSKAPYVQIVKFVTTKDLSLPMNKDLSADIVPSLSYALREIKPGKIFLLLS